MAFIPLPNGIKIAVEYSLNGQLVVNVYHVTTTLPITTVNLTALATVFKDWWNLSQRQNFTAGIGLTRVVATDVAVANGLQSVLNVSPAILGTIAAAPAPNNVAVVMSQRTGFSGRSFRGRSYYAGISTSEVTDNFISTTLQAALLLDGADLVSRLSTAGFIQSVASYQANSAPRVTAIATPITTLSMDIRVDTQRRRLPGTGE